MGAVERRKSAFAPGRLRSLWDLMRIFPITSFAHWIVSLEHWKLFRDNMRSIDGETKESWHKTFLELQGEIANLDLKASSASIRRLLGHFSKDKVKNKDVAKLSDELASRIIDELATSYFLALNMKEADNYINPRKGWEEIIKRFPETVGDVEEALKCFALSRYAACVFHSCQIVEIGLIELGTFIGVSDPLSGWTAVANALDKIVNKKSHHDRSPFEQKNFAFLEQMQGTVEALKNAWRNKISHANGKLNLLTKDFTAEIAEEIIFASRAFMRRLADGLPSKETPL